VTQIVGGYDDVDSYLAHKEVQRKQFMSIAPSVKAQATNISQQTQVKKKLSYKELRELELLPETIDTLESEIANLQEQVNNAEFFSQEVETTKKILNQLEQSESKLEATYARWQELDDQ
jgi:ATP-binding cassette subfamily F protein uup